MYETIGRKVGFKTWLTTMFFIGMPCAFAVLTKLLLRTSIIEPLVSLAIYATCGSAREITGSIIFSMLPLLYPPAGRRL